MRALTLMLLVACSGGTTVPDGGTAGGSAGGSAGGAAGGGSAGGSAGGAAGGSAGGAAGGAATGCAHKLCDDFESTDAGWTQLNGFGQGTVGLTTELAHSGTRSLKSTSANAGAPRWRKSIASLGATRSTHWGRVFYRVKTPAPKAMTASNYFHITFVGLRASAADESRVVDTVQSPSGTIQYLYNLPDDSCCSGSPYSWSYDNMWHCAEWYVNNSTDAYRFFIDGAEVTQIAFTGRTGARLADFNEVVLGAIYYVPSNGTLETYLDDLAIDDAQIGCQ